MEVLGPTRSNAAGLKVVSEQVEGLVHLADSGRSRLGQDPNRGAVRQATDRLREMARRQRGRTDLDGRYGYDGTRLREVTRIDGHLAFQSRARTKDGLE